MHAPALATQPPTRPHRVRRWLLRILSRTLAVLLLAIAVSLASLRLLLPSVEHYRAEVEVWLGASLGQRVTIGALHAYWDGWSPSLQAQEVHLLDASGGGHRNRSLARFGSVSVTIDPIASLRSGELSPANVAVTGASLVVARLQDGSISITGLADDAVSDNADTPDNLARLLLRQGRLEMHSTHIVWVDARADNAPISVSDVDLRVSNHGNLHQIRLSGRVDGQGDGRLSLIMDVEGDLLTPGWSGQVFGQIHESDLTIATPILRSLGLDDLRGVGELSVWSDWKFANLQRAEGEFALHGVSLPAGPSRLHLEAVRGKFLAERQRDGWTVELDRIEIQDAFDWPSTRLSLRYLDPRNGDGARVIGETGQLRVEHLLRFASSMHDQSDLLISAIRMAAPSGRIMKVGFTFEPDAVASTAELSAEFANFNMQAAGQLPSLGNVSGRLEMAPGRGALWTRSGTLLAPLPAWFDRPLKVDQLVGGFAWRRDRTGTRLELDDVGIRNQHLEARVTGTARWRANESAPELSLVVALQRMDLEHLPSYLPTKLMPERLSQWLTRAIGSGRLEDGEFLFHGRTDEIPFDHRQGRLIGRARVSKVNLDYAKGWPPIEDLSAELTVDGRRAAIRIDGGTVVGSRVATGHLRVDDIAAPEPILEIDGKLTGRTQQGAAFLRQSPLAPRFNHFLDSVSSRGKSELELSLQLPLLGKASTQQRRVSGVLRVSDNDVDLPGLVEGLQHVTGAFRFDGASVSAEKVEAEYLGRPIALVASARPGGDGTRIEIAGEATGSYLAAHLHNAGLIDSGDPQLSPWLARLRGAAHWQAVVEVPHVRDVSAPVATLRVTSDLVGAEFDLPAPLSKPADTRAPLEVRTRFSADGDRSMTVTYHDLVSAAFDLTPTPDSTGYRLKRGAIRFGGQTARLVDEPGILVDGTLPVLPLGDWYAIVGSMAMERPSRTDGAGQNPADPGVEEPSPLSGIRRVDIGIDDLRAFGARFRDTRIVADRSELGSWKAHVSGPAISGDIEAPADFREHALIARFDELTVHERVEDSPGLGQIIDPRSLPAFEFRCERCTLQDQDLGTIEIVARPFAKGSRFERLSLHGEAFEITGNGVWTYVDGKHASKVEATLRSQDLGNLLTGFGYQAGGAQGGPTTIQLNASWPNTPLDFDLSLTSGVLTFRASQGRLVQVKPGATGRLLGLLTVTSLPRRLALDFRDIFQEGLAYDYMEGSFGIHAGDAYTNNFVIESPTARIELTGRTGLVDEDYDQVVTITPKLSASLPLAPIWLAEKLLNKQIFDRVFAFRYTITGPWQDPVVEPVVVEPPDADLDRG